MNTHPLAQLIQMTNYWLKDPLDVRRIAAHRIIERGKGRSKVVRFSITPVKRLNAVDISVHLELLKSYDEMSLVFMRGEVLTGVPEEPCIISTPVVHGTIKLQNLEVGTYRLIVPMHYGIVMLDDPIAFYRA